MNAMEKASSSLNKLLVSRMLTNVLVRDPNELGSIIENLNGLEEYVNHYKQTISRNMEPEVLLVRPQKLRSILMEISRRFNGIMSSSFG